eukprot:gene36831-45437_t
MSGRGDTLSSPITASHGTQILTIQSPREHFKSINPFDLSLSIEVSELRKMYVDVPKTTVQHFQ